MRDYDWANGWSICAIGKNKRFSDVVNSLDNSILEICKTGIDDLKLVYPANAGLTLKGSYKSDLVRIKKFDNCEVVIENPFGSRVSLFIFVSANSILITKSLNLLVKATQSKPDAHMILSATLNMNSYTTHSIWRGIRFLPAGSVAKIKMAMPQIELFIRKLRIPTRSAHSNISDIFENIIHDQAKKYSTICIHVSGGVDSSSILLAANELKRQSIIATTWYDPHSSAHEDLHAATRIAQSLNIKHKHLPVETDLLFSVPRSSGLTPAPTTRMAFTGVLEYEEDCISEWYGNEETCLFDGHGGDHLWFDPASRYAIWDAFKIGGIGLAWVKAKQYSHYSIPLPQLWLSIIRPMSRKSGIGQRAYLFNMDTKDILGQEKDNKTGMNFPGKTKHFQMIWDAVYQNSRAMSLQSNLHEFHPFTQPDMIAYCAELNSFDLFNEEYTRLPFRREITRRYNSKYLLRRDKGTLTGLFQRALRKKQDYIFDLLYNGVLNRSGYLNNDFLEVIISKCIMGFDGFNYDLLCIISAEIHYNHCMRIST